MSKKQNDFLAEAAQLKEQADQLRVRRDELQGKVKSAEQEVALLSQERGAAILDGRDMTPLFNRLTRVRGDLDAFGVAIEEADRRIAKLDTEIVEKENSAKMTEFWEVSHQAESAIVQFMAKVEALLPELKAIAPIYAQLQKIAGIEMGGDQAVIMQKIYERLNAVFLVGGSDGVAVAWTLQDLEKSHRQYLQAARDRK